MALQIEKLSRSELNNTIFSIDNHDTFEKVALAIFCFQYQNCPEYKFFCDALNISSENVTALKDIPFMPIDFFREHRITTTLKQADICFYSSTTTSSTPSKHYVADLKIYNESLERCFRIFFGDPSDYCFIALLPGYLKRGNSSLAYMVNKLMKLSNNRKSGFFMKDYARLKSVLEDLNKTGEKAIIIGVSHALLDFGESYNLNLTNSIIMETGGMKGQGKELIRDELHNRLKIAYGVKEITSEYGMTELLSQAYSLRSGVFKTPPWMKVFIRETNDPFVNVLPGRTGTINVIDLANVFSCSFIATHDLGKQNPDSSFEVLGRLDNSEIRGCNLMFG